MKTKCLAVLFIASLTACGGSGGIVPTANQHALTEANPLVTPTPDLVVSGIGGGTGTVVISIPTAVPTTCVPPDGVVLVVTSGSVTPPPCTP
jgi:hypothetical protein